MAANAGRQKCRRMGSSAVHTLNRQPSDIVRGHLCGAESFDSTSTQAAKFLDVLGCEKPSISVSPRRVGIFACLDSPTQKIRRSGEMPSIFATWPVNGIVCRMGCGIPIRTVRVRRISEGEHDHRRNLTKRAIRSRIPLSVSAKSFTGNADAADPYRPGSLTR